ncbi:hypothetical protein [Streptomyces sp. NPDC058307]|uniref:hypothetical protein n=1 Tax=Streptomyces sp. NPDC058307 TaxID=3346439 RepID=UPI0036E33766
MDQHPATVVHHLTAGQAGDAPAFTDVMARPRDPRAPAQARHPGGEPRTRRPARTPATSRRPRQQVTGLDPATDEQRNTVERCVNRLKQWRGLAT